jgi:hypothetical protein
MLTTLGYWNIDKSILLRVQEGLNGGNEITTSEDEGGDVAATVRESHLLEGLELTLELIDRRRTTERWS